MGEEYQRQCDAEQKHREGFRAPDYTGEACNNCGRNRVMNCVNGKKVCEKCGWDNVAKEYTDFLSI